MNRMLPVLIAGGAAAGLALVPATASAATPNNVITVDVGINKIRTGDSLKKVNNKMGTTGVAGKTGMLPNGLKTTIYKYPGKFRVQIAKGYGVNAMWTTGPRQSTNDGVAVGSSRSELVNSVEVMCNKLGGGKQFCTTEDMPTNGDIVTTFRLTNRVITEISIAVLLD